MKTITKWKLFSKWYHICPVNFEKVNETRMFVLEFPAQKHLNSRTRQPFVGYFSEWVLSQFPALFYTPFALVLTSNTYSLATRYLPNCNTGSTHGLFELIRLFLFLMPRYLQNSFGIAWMCNFLPPHVFSTLYHSKSVRHFRPNCSVMHCLVIRRIIIQLSSITLYT